MSLVWRFRALIVVFAAVGAVLGVTLAVRAPVTYEATVSLTMLSPDADGSGLPSTRESVAASRLFGRLALSGDVLSRVMDEFDLRRRYGRTPETLVACCLAVEPLTNSDVFHLKVTLPDSELSARVANRIVELAIQRSRVLGQAYLDTVRGQLDQARERLEDLEQRLATTRRNSQRRTALADLSARLASQREQVRQAERELAHAAGSGRVTASGRETGARSLVDTGDRHVVATSGATDVPAVVRRSSDDPDNPVLGQERQAPLNAPPAGDDLGQGTHAEGGVAISLGELLQYELAEKRIRLSGLEKEREYWQRESPRPPDAAGGPSTNAPEHEVAEDRLALERELAARTYGDAVSQYDQARLKLAATPTPIQVIPSASPPRASGRVPAVAGLVAGGIAGLLISLVLGITWSYMASSRTMEPAR